MNKNYKLLFLIITMLLLLTFIVSTINYKTTAALIQNQITKQSLPLSLDNIYTDIQKQILEPYLITSMMANDTFVKEWLQNNADPKKIKNYLASIKEKYGLLSAILVQDKTKRYYTQDGFLEVLDPNNRDNKWYFRFKNSQKSREINIDTNVKIDKSLIMFMNNKILDENNKLIGITSTGVKIVSIHKMLTMFKEKYHLEVYLFDNAFNIILMQKSIQGLNTIDELEEFNAYKEELLSKTATMFEYENSGDTFSVNTKYIPELDIHILVKAKLSDFTEATQNTLYFNLLISILVISLVGLVILYIVRSSMLKLQKSNEQKDILLKEVHHRVKNNLNVTASMIGLQAMQESKEIQYHLLKTKSRIEAIASVHEMLYTHNDFQEINFYDYLRKLELLFFNMYKNSENCVIIIDVNRSLTLPLDTMIQFGILINEMLTNSVKYSNNKELLKITISLAEDTNELVFTYRDNGEDQVDIQLSDTGKGLGNTLIKLSVQQLNGSLQRSYENGLCYKVRFKNAKYSNS